MVKLIHFIFIIIVILSISLSYSVPPFTSETSQGLQIRPPGIDTLRVGQDFDFPIHVINYSDGVYITSASCYFHLYNSEGEHIITLFDNSTSYNFDYEFPVKGKNFTAGNYFANIQCNTSKLGGATRFDFEVTPIGKQVTTPLVGVYSIILLFILIIISSSIYFSMRIESNHETNLYGDIIKINYKKYIKYGLLIIAYTGIVVILYLLWSISFAFSGGLDTAQTYFYRAFRLSYLAFYPFIVIMFVYTIVRFLNDKKLEKYLTSLGRDLSGQEKSYTY